MLSTPQQLRRTLKKRQIAGNLYRADDGKFTAGSGGDTSAPAESETPAKTPPKRAQNAAARRERSAAEAEARAAEDAAEQATRDEEDAKVDGAKTPKERQALRREIARARRERAAARRTARAERQAGERSKRGEEDAAATEEAAQPKAPKAKPEKKPKKGGGGGGGGKGDKQETPEQAAKRAQVEARRAEADKRRAAMDARRERQDAQREQDRAKREEWRQRELSDLAQRAQTPGMKLTPNELERLVVEGLAEREGTQVSLTAAGRAQARRKPKQTKEATYVLARQPERAGAQRGGLGADVRREVRARHDGPQSANADRQAGRDAERARAKAYEPGQLCPYCTADLALPDEGWYRCGHCNGAFYAADTDSDYEDYHAYREDRASSRGAPPQPATLPTARVLKPPREKEAPLLRVFKDAKGADRWLTITTTAYEDRDAEIITTKGIAYAVAYGDATGERGTLRFWHVPGMDLGPCDYQAQGGPGGRWLVESGTFYGPREAALGRAMAEKGWHMSPGFLHPTSEPYAVEIAGRRLGLYDHPMIFERSPTPPGRASNLFGRFSTKEKGMNEEKRAALKELVGGDEALLADLLGRIEQTDKAAQTAGVAFKDAPEWATALLSRIEALEATTKAPMPAEEMVEAGATEMMDGAEEEAEAEGESDNLLSPGEIQAIADAVAATLMGAIDGISAKMAEVDNELKGRGYQRMKEFADGEFDKLKTSVAAIEATVKELAGVAPARGYQGSKDNADLPAELAAMLKGETPSDDPYADVMKFLRPVQ